MSIPFDNLYHWVQGLLPEPAIMYTFDPPGSKDIQCLDYFQPYNEYDVELCPELICHDQEPLDFALYQNLPKETVLQLRSIQDNHAEVIQQANLKAALNCGSIYDQAILLHSEKNSDDLEKYQQLGFIPVHFWSHAVIARDWFRFAQHDLRLRHRRPGSLFLIYNRDWRGSREYRLKFAEMLVQHQLLSHSRTSMFKQQDPRAHRFSNLLLCPAGFDFVDAFADNTFLPKASADYCAQDFVECRVSVVLETVFDSTKIHLTEKVLRPIACGQPFLLAAGPGSLEYLRRYGFRTFAPWIDESYDSESDSVLRLQKIVSAMRQLSDLPDHELDHRLDCMQEAVDHNRRWFFSQEFANMIAAELAENLQHAFEQVKHTRGRLYLNRWPRANKNRTKRIEKLKKLKHLRRSSV